MISKSNTMKLLQSLFALVVVTMCISCNNLTLEDPTLERIEDVDIKEISRERIDMNANIVIHNPNAVALDLASADLDVLLDNIVIANIKQTFDAIMPAKAEFKLPVNITMDLAKLYKENPLAALSKGLKIMSDKKLEVVFKGNIKAGKGIIKLTVDVNQVELVQF